MKGDLVTAVFTLKRNQCSHSASSIVDIACECEPRELPVTAVGEVFSRNGEELDADVLEVLVDGRREVAMSPTETTEIEQALIDEWTRLLDEKTGRTTH